MPQRRRDGCQKAKNLCMYRKLLIGTETQPHEAAHARKHISGCQCEERKWRRRDVYSMYDRDKKKPEATIPCRDWYVYVQVSPEPNSKCSSLKYPPRALNKPLAVHKAFPTPVSRVGGDNPVRMRVAEEKSSRKRRRRCSLVADEQHRRKMCRLRSKKLPNQYELVTVSPMCCRGEDNVHANANILQVD